MIQTPNLGLEKYELTDAANLADGYNNSMDTLDKFAGNINAHFPIKASDIADGAIINTKISNGAVDENKLAAASVTNTKIATDSVTADKIPDDAIINRHYSEYSITGDKIADNTLPITKLSETFQNTIKNQFDNILPIASIDVSNIPQSETLLIVNDGITHTFNNVIFPNNITIMFVSGMFAGTFTIEGTVIAPLQQIFDIKSNVTIVNNTTGYPEWFGAIINSADAASTNVAAIQKCISIYTNTMLHNGHYYINNTISINANDKVLSGYSYSRALESAVLHCIGNFIAIDLGSTTSTTFECNSPTIQNIGIYFESDTITLNAVGIRIVSTINAHIEQILIQNCGIGVITSNAGNARIKNITVVLNKNLYNAKGFYITSLAAFYSGVGTNASCYVDHFDVFSDNGMYNNNAYGLYFDGRGIADNFISNFETAFIGNGVYLNLENTILGEYSNQDAHFTRLILDSVTNGFTVYDTDGNKSPIQILISDSYIMGKTTGNCKLINLFSNISHYINCQINVVNTCLLGSENNINNTIAISGNITGANFSNLQFKDIGQILNGTIKYSRINGNFAYYSFKGGSNLPAINVNAERTFFDLGCIGVENSYPIMYAGTYANCLFNFASANNGIFTSGLLDSNSPTISNLNAPYTKNSNNNAYIG